MYLYTNLYIETFNLDKSTTSFLMEEVLQLSLASFYTTRSEIVALSYDLKVLPAMSAA
jgi:hypothetical protein